MTFEDIRRAYLSYFKEKQHAIIQSSPLLPENDPTTLFTGSGMQPMIPYLLGEPHPLGRRIADSQKCFRTQDIDEVGDNRHTTFFEMLGNWSLGDPDAEDGIGAGYFKQEQIPWMFEFLTQRLGLDPKNLYVSVFRGNDEIGIARDTESVEIWKQLFATAGIEAIDMDFSERDGMQGGRIFYYDDSKNWWSRSGVPKNMPIGEPGGPDTEMFWDFSAEGGSASGGEPSFDIHANSPYKNEPCHVNCDCGRFMEIGNNVFMQYKKTETGFEELAQKNVDFGGGLERMAAAVNHNPDIFLTDVFDGARNQIEENVGKRYVDDENLKYSFRVVLDHIRAATFLIGDGVYPSNKDQGYFVRRLIRRAVLFSRKISSGAGVERAQITRSAAGAFIDVYKKAYPNLEEKRTFILDAIEQEEEKFAKTVDQGLKELHRIIERTKEFSGKDAFDLYQSFGFPLELTIEELERSYKRVVDTDSFRVEFEKHKALSRAGSEQKFKGGLADTSEMSVRYHTATHMLHKALKMVLGNHVAQKGSNITAERLRFDFSHPEKMTPEQIAQVEQIVNEEIQKNHPVHFEMLTLEEARARGATGLFEDKYATLGDKLKVYFIGDEGTGEVFSMEVCGGPHVEKSGELGKFRILKEEAVSAGVRRIKAVLE